MSTFPFIEATEWHCAGCDRPLVPTPVKVSYLHSVFNVELMACPGQGGGSAVRGRFVRHPAL